MKCIKGMNALQRGPARQEGEGRLLLALAPTPPSSHEKKKTHTCYTLKKVSVNRNALKIKFHQLMKMLLSEKGSQERTVFGAML